MAVPARISLVTLGVADLARSTAFYTALGWRPSSISNDAVTFYPTADGVLALYPFRRLAEDAGVPVPDGPAVGSVTLAVNVDGEAEVDRVLAEVEAAGGTVTSPGARAVWGGYTGTVADPDGHLWEVAHNPGFPIDERGQVVLPE